MAQQTAVEWLIEQIEKKNGKEFASFYSEFIQEAKAMEKEQIMKAVYDSMGTNFDPNWGRAELYYNETYGK